MRHDHIFLFGMSATYTRLTQHRKSTNAGNVEFPEQVHPHDCDSGFRFQEDKSVKQSISSFLFSNELHKNVNFRVILSQ